MRRSLAKADNTRVLRLINYCDTQILNPSEYSIITAIFSHISKDSYGGEIESLKQIADEANISQASVTRFLRKIGYKDFADFKQNYAKEFFQLYQVRDSFHANIFRSVEAIDVIYDHAINNMEKTYANINRHSLKEAAMMMDYATNVSIFGDDHVQSIFYTMQLDLMARGVPTFMFKNEEMQQMHYDFIQSGDVIFFATVSSDFIRPDQRAFLKKMHERDDVKVIILSQDTGEVLEKCADLYIPYGIPNSVNNGFYSLMMISQIMSETLYDL